MSYGHVTMVYVLDRHFFVWWEVWDVPSMYLTFYTDKSIKGQHISMEFTENTSFLEIKLSDLP